MFCGEIISNFVDSSEYYDKSRLYIMNGGQRSNHSTVSWTYVRAKDLQYEGWKIQVANICLEWALTKDKPLIFDEILEDEEEDKILENEILEMIEMWKIHR